MSFHDPSWAEFLSECYGFRAFVYAVADEAGELTTGVPLMEVRGLSRRKRWIALPFTDACPILGTDVDALVHGLEDARLAAGIAQVELRTPIGDAARELEVAKTHLLTLDSDADAVFKRFRGNVRQGIRAAEKAGVSVRRATDREELTRIFYDLHVATRRRLGVPVQSRRFFELLWDRVLAPGGGYVGVASVDGEDAAAAVFLEHGGSVVYKFGASDERHLRARPNNALFWDAIRRACEEGRRSFDFGRSDFAGEGLRRFKSSWAADELPLVYSALGTPLEAHGESRALALAGAIIRRTPPFVCRASSVLYRFAA
jgi:CelD/BcsL family acetyltransferase involved in cellulose biosynthesis